MKSRQLWVGATHLAVLWAFAFQRPLFDLLGRNPEFFVARGNVRGDILAYAFAFTLLPPLAMLGVEVAVLRLRRSLYTAVHLTFLALLGAAFALQLLKDNVTPGPAGVLILVALALGASLALAYRRTVFAGQALSFLAPVPFLFLATFLLFSPVHKLVLPQQKAVAATTVQARTPVVVLFFDEFPLSTILDESGHIDARRFPNFAELAAHSTWYRNATTVADKTPRAVPAMLTGHNPGYHLLPIASDQPRNIFSMLGAGYRVQAIETATRMCPGAICHGSGAPEGSFGSRFGGLVSDLRVVSEHLLLPGGIAKNLPPIGQTFGGFGSSLGEPQTAHRVKVTARYQQDYDAKLRRAKRLETPGGKSEMFGDFARRIGPDDGVFNFLDIQLPHFPWEYVETAQHYAERYPDMDNYIIDDPPGRFIDNDWLVEQSYARHMLQSGAADHLLGTLIDRMKREGLWDRATLIVSADHGVSFHAGGFRREVRADNLQDIAFVPLFVRSPHQARAKVVDGHACTTQIPQLLSATLGVKWPWTTDRCDPHQIGVLNSRGSVQHGSLEQYEALRADAVRRKFALFGEDWNSVYRFGPDPDLVGDGVGSLHIERDDGRPNHVSFDSDSDVSDVDPTAHEVPALLQGTIDGVSAPDGGLPLAISVSGRIAAVTRAYALGGATRFIATVPPRAYRRGRNSLEVFEIGGAEPHLVLHSLGGANLSR
jgi:hypothetical protein